MHQQLVAQPIWGSDLSNDYNQFLGFHTVVDTTDTLVLRITARSYYRLFVNGELTCAGPARTAARHCRMDEIQVKAKGVTHLAFEVVALSKPETYCNDCTMEPGLFLCQVEDAAGSVLSATGDDTWHFAELMYRRSLVETLSHARGALEYYDLTPESFAWRMGETSWKTPVTLEEQATLLPRHSKYPTYRALPMDSLTQVSDIVRDQSIQPPDGLFLARYFNPAYYSLVPQENCFVADICQESDAIFTGQMRRLSDKRIEVTPGNNPAGVVWERRVSDLGFIDFDITVSAETTVDLVNTDHRGLYGAIRGNSHAVRYHLAPGSYHLTTFDPKLVRYIKLIMRTTGTVVVSQPQLIEYTYPDTGENSFACSDGDLNRIYDAARRTLRLNTLDIFMDCPQRERGGWLCDSQFSAPAAWMLFGDLGVEHDFLENFLLTDPDVCWNAFFPEVYPSVRKSPEKIGISNWSFWLATELYNYYQRSGDRAFVDAHAPRVARFVEGMLSLRGESGLLENLPDAFVDWSLSNESFSLAPVSVPLNCLAVCVLERMAELYGRGDWAQAANEMRGIIEGLDRPENRLFGNGDAAAMTGGRLQRGKCRTESGMALELWSGFHADDYTYVQQFTNALGPAPEYRPNPNVGRSNLFIGLMVRFDVLARLGRFDALLHELRSIYLQELRDGSGTFFENVQALSGCHGFNGYAGALVANHVLGLGAPSERDKTVAIAPHPERLRWANGTALTSDGTIFLSWASDADRRELNIQLNLPEGWSHTFEKAPELAGWTVTLNGRPV